MRQKIYSLCALLLLPTSLWAGVNVAAPFLQAGAGGRAKGMGENYTAVAAGPFAAFYNPAGLAGVESLSLGFQHEAVADLELQDVLAGSFPLGPGGASALVDIFTYGALDMRDASGQLTGEQITPMDSLISLGYGLGMGRDLQLGANLGFFSENLGTTKISGVVLDLGSSWNWSPEGRVAAVVKNLGSGPSGYNLPTCVRLAGAHALFDRRLLVDVEADLPLAANSFDAGLGVEYQAWKWLALRAGYKGPLNNAALESLVGGLGFNFWNLDLDFAVTSRGDAGSQVCLSLVYAFIPPRPGQKEKSVEKDQALFHYHAGRKYEKHSQWVEALVEYKAALNIRPDFPEAQKALVNAREQARLQNQPTREESFRAGISESLQQTIRKYYEQGLTAYKNHDYSTAIRPLQLVLELTTPHRQAPELLEKAKEALRSELGVLRSQARQAKERGDLAQEIEARRKIMELDPENKELKAELAAAEKKVPATVDALYKQGVDFYAKGQLRPALKTFQTLLQLQPDHVKAKDAVENIKEKLIRTGQ
jgi:tetratricopeptide (TPR) repeat protein